MRVAVTLRFDVDPKVWAAEYGTSSDPQAVRADIKTYFDNWLKSCLLTQDGIITDGEAR